MSTTIYYFSATGNSLKVTKDLSEQLTDAEIVQISKKSIPTSKDTQSDKIGFVFPVYNLGLPVMVKNFIETLKIDKHTYVFAIATCGGMVGAALDQIKKILNKKDIKLAAPFCVFMPGSDQLMFPTVSEEEQNKLFKDEEKQISTIALAIKSSQHVKYKANAIMSSTNKL